MCILDQSPGHIFATTSAVAGRYRTISWASGYIERSLHAMDRHAHPSFLLELSLRLSRSANIITLARGVGEERVPLPEAQRTDARHFDGTSGTMALANVP